MDHKCESIVNGSWCDQPATVRVRATVKGAPAQTYEYCGQHVMQGQAELSGIFTKTAIVDILTNGRRAKAY